MGKILELSDVQKVIDQRTITNIEDLKLPPLDVGELDTTEAEDEAWSEEGANKT